jgi:hypothetical protein
MSGVGRRRYLGFRAQAPASARTWLTSLLPFEMQPNAGLIVALCWQLDNGESAGALKFRQLRMALLGPSPKTVVTIPPSPLSLFKHLGAAAIGSRSSEQGVEISLAPQSLATPSLLPLAKSPAERTDGHRDASASGLEASVPPQGKQDSGGGGGWSAEPPSPLSQFIGMFQSASRREVSKHILRVWKKRTVAARRLSAASLTALSETRLSSSSALESPTGVADQDDLGASGTLFNIQFSTRQQGDAPTRSGPSQDQEQQQHQQQHKFLADTLGQVFWWVRTLLLRGAFRQWRTTARARALERLTLQRFRSRRLRRLLYDSFHRWGFTCQLE